MSNLFAFKLSAVLWRVEDSNVAVAHAVIAGFSSFWILDIFDLAAHNSWYAFSISSSFKSNPCLSVPSSLSGSGASVCSWCLASTSSYTLCRSDNSFRTFYVCCSFTYSSKFVKRWNGFLLFFSFLSISSWFLSYLILVLKCKCKLTMP